MSRCVALASSSSSAHQRGAAANRMIFILLHHYTRISIAPGNRSESTGRARSHDPLQLNRCHINLIDLSVEIPQCCLTKSIDGDRRLNITKRAHLSLCYFTAVERIRFFHQRSPPRLPTPSVLSSSVITAAQQSWNHRRRNHGRENGNGKFGNTK